MRPAFLLLLLCGLAAAPPLAQAGVRLHLPHKRHHHDRGAPPAPDAPTSDMPQPVLPGGVGR